MIIYCAPTYYCSMIIHSIREHTSYKKYLLYRRHLQFEKLCSADIKYRTDHVFLDRVLRADSSILTIHCVVISSFILLMCFTLILCFTLIIYLEFITRSATHYTSFVDNTIRTANIRAPPIYGHW
ncbi:hypothetical protein METBIDRAFT_181877 [Metschnikowia bicuspidata var. bicuspidata NRRL YB-4993]|uniref:Uncharacterized protein n=1 Tax=Metschnikowia bicuspidata var. bicuspidata NRRL YB-4993 TaxID=869754 RepID=A0A1A0HBJ7_9ASCO|nr:hypothetical protein METBIDRAFT_181877 [Metschnikowia bicuspidata var. bicuspidata NRRL YB-4993]OBA21360.1 hypothetical protein METBIDRAFT_181877 [Metschnikowia bicuspidata var. bicuspidata NRRL YB-4993]